MRLIASAEEEATNCPLQRGSYLFVTTAIHSVVGGGEAIKLEIYVNGIYPQ